MSKEIKIIRKMLDNDPFSQWLGIELVSCEKEEIVIKMQVREEMNNGFGISHGGIVYSFCDSAFAFLSNSYGKHAVSIESSISHISKIQAGDILWARAQKVNKGNRIANFIVKATNQTEELVAHFKGTVFITSNEWEV
jgi:acyl-CoA thioesterase